MNRYFCSATIMHFAMAALGTVGPTFAAEPPSLHKLNGQFITYARPSRPRTVLFERGDGININLSSFRGKVVLLNFWTTWCPPCVWEMPALDYLQKRFGGRNFEVVAVSLDRTGIKVVVPFYRKHMLKNLKIYLDPEQRLGNLAGRGDPHAPFNLFGLPVTYIIDRSGRVRGYVIGALKWNTPPAVAFVRYFLCEAVACPNRKVWER